MRLILLTVLLAACDQGATPSAVAAPAVAKPQAPVQTVPSAPPPYMVKDTDDFVAKANVAVDELLGIFAQGGKDCDVVAAGLRRFGEVNRTRFDVLTRYSDTHPDAQQALSTKMNGRMGALTETLMPTMTACASHAGLRAALEELAASQHLQRPR
jgi:hypothetical protein